MNEESDSRYVSDTVVPLVVPSEKPVAIPSLYQTLEIHEAEVYSENLSTVVSDENELKADENNVEPDIAGKILNEISPIP